MKKQRGITLIALIITIIVMLILVSVTVTFTIGENGILSQAKQAKVQQDKATEQEELIIEAYATYGKEAKFNQAKFKVAIEEKGYTFNEATGEITSPKGNVFIIDEEGKITEKEIIKNDILISTVEEWTEFANAINTGTGEKYERYQGKVIGLKNDIDFTGKEFTPVGTLNFADLSGVAFEGTFNGQGKSLKNITYTNNSGIATVFVSLNDATITDLTVEGGTFTGYAATGICGITTGNVIVKNCINSNNCNGYVGAIGIGGSTMDIFVNSNTAQKRGT